MQQRWTFQRCRFQAAAHSFAVGACAAVNPAHLPTLPCLQSERYYQKHLENDTRLPQDAPPFYDGSRPRYCNVTVTATYTCPPNDTACNADPGAARAFCQVRTDAAATGMRRQLLATGAGCAAVLISCLTCPPAAAQNICADLRRDCNTTVYQNYEDHPLVRRVCEQLVNRPPNCTDLGFRGRPQTRGGLRTLEAVWVVGVCIWRAPPPPPPWPPPPPLPPPPPPPPLPRRPPLPRGMPKAPPPPKYEVRLGRCNTSAPATHADAFPSLMRCSTTTRRLCTTLTRPLRQHSKGRKEPSARWLGEGPQAEGGWTFCSFTCCPLMC